MEQGGAVDSVSREQGEGGDQENRRTRFRGLEMDTGQPLPFSSHSRMGGH